MAGPSMNGSVNSGAIVSQRGVWRLDHRVCQALAGRSSAPVRRRPEVRPDPRVCRPQAATQNAVVPFGVPLPVGPSHPGAALQSTVPHVPLLPETTS